MVNLLDLPQELLLIILRAHFASLNVHVGRRPIKKGSSRTKHFLDVLRSCKKLYHIGYHALLEEATFHFTHQQKTSYYLAYPPDHARHFQHICGTSYLARYLFDVPRTIQGSYPKIKSVLIKDKVDMRNYRLETEPPKILWRLKRLRRHCKERGLAFDAYLSLTCRPTGMPAMAIWKVKIAIRGTDGPVELCQAVQTEQAFFDIVRARIQQVFEIAIEKPEWPTESVFRIFEGDTGREWQE